MLGHVHIIGYSDVTAVVQVGVASGREQYVHRIGRTARAGKAGGGFLLLAECEAPFLKLLTDLPLRQRPALAPARCRALQGALATARGALPRELLVASYAAWLGFYNVARSTAQLAWSKEEMVAHATAFAKGVLGLATPPCLGDEALLKMGLLGTAGLARSGGGEDGGGAAAAERDGSGWTNPTHRASGGLGELTGAAWLAQMARESGEGGGGAGSDGLDGRVGNAWDYGMPAKHGGGGGDGGGKGKGGGGKGKGGGKGDKGKGGKGKGGKGKGGGGKGGGGKGGSKPFSRPRDGGISKQKAGPGGGKKKR